MRVVSSIPNPFDRDHEALPTRDLANGRSRKGRAGVCGRGLRGREGHVLHDARGSRRGGAVNAALHRRLRRARDRRRRPRHASAQTSRTAVVRARGAAPMWNPPTARNAALREGSVACARVRQPVLIRPHRPSRTRAMVNWGAEEIPSSPTGRTRQVMMPAMARARHLAVDGGIWRSNGERTPHAPRCARKSAWCAPAWSTRRREARGGIGAEVGASTRRGRDRGFAAKVESSA